MTNPWKGILDEDETILWHGKPDPAFAMARDDVIMMAFGLVFAGFAVLWMAIAVQAGSFFWMFGVIHFSVGLALAVYGVLRDTVARRYSYYTLTSRRAIIGVFYPWAARSLRKYRITKSTRIRTDRGNTVVFGPPSKIRRGPFPSRTPQFTRIDDAEKVYHLMQQIQKETP